MFERIQEQLDMHHISATEMCSKTGISTGNVSDWKSGRSSPSAEKLSRMADFFGVTVDYLMGRSDAPQTMTVDEQELLRIFNAASHEGKVMILARAFEEKRRMQEMEA